MAKGAAIEGILTFVFTDIVGSTRLWERAPQATERALARHYEIVRSDAQAMHGEVFKTVGDACCCVFEDAAGAVRAAVSIQRSLAAESWPSDIADLRVRIGVHSGIAIHEKDDYFGQTLNRVARITAAANGGQILLSGATADLARAELANECELLDLGAHRLKDLAEPQILFQVVAENLIAEFPPLASLDAHPNNLPSQISTFVGRETELEELRTLLDHNRIVTICGPGGIGKTRLALQVAAERVALFKGGTWLVRLADIAERDLVPQLIAATLHLSEVPGTPLEETIVEYLRTRNAFLVFDSSDLIVEATARVVTTLLQSCPQVSILATSREPLHVAGEHVLRIGSMTLREAALLFAERAQMKHDEKFVRDVCARVDCVPLAIELTAARAGTLTIEQLESRLNLLTTKLASKDVAHEERHRTVNATIDWSYRLLNAQEQRCFARLSVFESGFTLEACEAVVADRDFEDPAFVLLDALVDKSFVTAEPADRGLRYRMLDALRSFARAKLEPSDDVLPAHQFHYAYFSALAKRYGAWSSLEEERAYLAAFEREMPNIRAALDWGLAREDNPGAFEFLMYVSRYWQLRCNIAEARTWYERAIALARGAYNESYARLLRRAATLATIEDDYAAARSLTDRALRVFREQGDLAGAAEAMHNLAVIEQRSGSEDEALRLYRLALEGFEKTGHTLGTISALYNLAQTAMHREDFDVARAALERGKSACTPEYSDRLASFWWLQGDLAMRTGAFDDARAALERALAMKRDLHDRHDEVEVMRTLAALCIRTRRMREAATFARESLRIARELDIDSLTIGCLELYAVIYAKAKREPLALRLLGYANALRRARGYTYSIMNELAPELSVISTKAYVDVDLHDLPRVLDDLLSPQGVL